MSFKTAITSQQKHQKLNFSSFTSFIVYNKGFKTLNQEQFLTGNKNQLRTTSA